MNLGKLRYKDPDQLAVNQRYTVHPNVVLPTAYIRFYNVLYDNAWNSQLQWGPRVTERASIDPKHLQLNTLIRRCQVQREGFTLFQLAVCTLLIALGS